MPAFQDNVVVIVSVFSHADGGSGFLRNHNTRLQGVTFPTT
jgi:hypothetical protein